jgi:hypothetical protein
MVWQRGTTRRLDFGGAGRSVCGRWRRIPVAAAALVFVVAQSGCVGDPGADSRARPAVSARQIPPVKASPTPAGKATICARALAVQNSLGALTAQDYTETGSARRAIAQVQKNLRSLRAVASAEWEEQVSALSEAVAKLGRAIDNLRGQDTTAKDWRALGAAAEGVGKRTDDLRKSLASTCPDLQKGLDEPRGR